MSTEINIKKRITALDESVILTKDLNSINFVGAGVVASAIAEDVTVTIGGGIAGSGTTNYLSKWTAATTLGNSQTRDNGSNIAVNGTILSSYKFAVYSTTPGENYNIYGNTTVNGAVGVGGVNQGVGASTNYGTSGEAQNSSSLNIGVYGQAIGTSVENVGGKFSATLATSNYAVQLQDGTEGIGKVLTSMTADSKAQWVTPASGTVISVTGTAPVVSSGGTTPAISIPAATTSVNGYLTSTDWTTFNNKGNGTVTSVSALTLGTTGTDLSSTVATGTSTPVITLQVPTASAVNRGALSSSDWTTFNAKQATISLTTTGTSGAATLIGTTLNIPQYAAASSTWNVTTQVGASYTAVSNDYVLVNAATQTVTLPAAANGIRVGVKMINATVTNIRVLTPSAGVTIDGTNRSVTGMPIFNQYDAYTFVSDGTNWWIIG